MRLDPLAVAQTTENIDANSGLLLHELSKRKYQLGHHKDIQSGFIYSTRRKYSVGGSRFQKKSTKVNNEQPVLTNI